LESIQRNVVQSRARLALDCSVFITLYNAWHFNSTVGDIYNMRKKVAIIGNGLTRKHAPYEDDSWDIWGLNEIEQPRVDVWFEMHPIEVQSERELKWLKRCKKPIYMLEKYESIPKSYSYPLEEVLKVPGARDYFTCTFAYQIALALHLTYEEIGLWGMQLANGTAREQTVERMCVEWWLGLAIGKGVKVTTADKFMRHNYHYGYDYYDEMYDVITMLTALQYRGMWVRKEMIGTGDVE